MVIRAFLGVAETAFAPGVTYYLSMIYRRREVGLRQGLYLGYVPGFPQSPEPTFFR